MLVNDLKLKKRAGKRLGVELKSSRIRTQQSFRNQCDINEIVERARVAGFVSHVNSKPPVYGDVSTIPDYQSALGVVNTAREAFEALPSKTRERFNNDPSRMIAFISDKNNYDEAVKLGLVTKKEVPPVPPVVPVNADALKS